MHIAHLTKIICQTTSFCWFLWAVLEASTNTATFVQTENTVHQSWVSKCKRSTAMFGTILLLLLLLLLVLIIIIINNN